MNKLLGLVLLLFGTFAVSAQTQCPSNLIGNGDLETGTPTAFHQDIGNADGFRRIWAPGSWADYYDASSGPFSQPAPATGNYASCWIVHNNSVGFREGFQLELDFALPPNTGTYTLTFDMACLRHSWGTVEVGIYGLHNPTDGDAPNPPTSATTPNNLNLFAPGNTVLLQTIAQDASDCSNSNKTTYSVAINTNAASFPAGGMTHIFITRSDATLSGGIYAGFDNFCISVPDDCPGNYVVNGDLETGTPTASHQDIANATGFDGIWATGSLADYYTATAGPFTPPTPPSGNYASCWIANYNGGGTTYREGFKGTLVANILPNTGVYELTFDMACLHGWGNSEVAVYGINNPGGTPGATPTGAYTPSNTALYGATNTILAGVIPVSSGSCSNVKAQQSVFIDSDDPSFPAAGISHFFVTHSDNSSINGALYMGFDNFCLHTSDTTLFVPCPQIDRQDIVCIPDVNGDGVPDYQVTFFVSDDAAGSIGFVTSCGTITPTPINLNGSGSYTTTVVSNGSCPSFSLTYTVVDASGQICNRQDLKLDLPKCPPCPTLEKQNVICIPDVNGDGVPDYQITFVISDDAAGSLGFSTSCGTISPNPIALNGSGSYTATIVSNGSCPTFDFVYFFTDAGGRICNRDQLSLKLPDCPVQRCPCDEFFFDAVNAGFVYSEGCPNDLFTPTSLIDPCDRVDWTIDGIYVGSTVGNATLVTPHTNGSYIICMTVTRTDPATGRQCRHEFCREIRAMRICPVIGPVFKINVQPNPAQDQAVVSWATDEAPEQLSIRVFNIQGVQVLEQLTVNGYDGQTQLDLSRLADGVYYIHAGGEGYSVPPIKLIKQ